MNIGLAPRQEAVLRAVVREYIRTGEPVGSKPLVGRYRLGVSSATVRNDMARLEELNLLTQPHTSAGRVPTEEAYRFFVSTLPGPAALPRAAERTVEEELGREPEGVDDLLARASDLASRLARYTAAVLAPRTQPGRVRRIELVALGMRAVSVVVVCDTGRVEQRIARLEEDLVPAEVERLCRSLNRIHDGVEVDAAGRAVRIEASDASGAAADLLTAVAETLEAAAGVGGRVFVGGVSHLAEEESFERETLHQLYQVVERQVDLLGLLAEALERPVSVRIGSDLPLEELHGCSLVVAPYGPAAEPLGTVGVLGPTRMDYARAMAAAVAIARSLEGTLDRLTR